jgi:GAF domain-containing protein
MRLRSHLVALVLAALVPVLGFAALVMRENARLQLVAGAVVASALAAGLAFLLGRRIAGAVGGLVRIARAVERGDRAEPLLSGVTEVNEVAEQLSTAAELARTREQETALRERQARAIADVAHALAASPDLDTVLRTAVDAVRGLVRADSARIALVDETGRLVVRYSTVFSSMMSPGFEIAKGHGVGGLAWATGRPVRTDDFRHDPRFRDSPYVAIAIGDGIVSCLTVPIVSSGAVVGVIYANNFTLRPFTDGEQAALVTLADHAAVAVEKARLLSREHTARAAAEAASRGKDELLAMLGHELRNPLSAIATAVHVLETGDPSAEVARRALEIIARQNAHLAHLVDDLLDMARVTSGKIALVRRPLELGQAVRHGLATLAASGRAERHRVTVDLVRSGPTWTRRASSRSSTTSSATRSASRRPRAPSRSACAATTAKRSCASATVGWGSRPRCCPASSTSSPRAITGPTAARAVWGSASPWSAASPSCTAAAWRRPARARGMAARSRCACPRSPRRPPRRRGR